MKVKWIATLVLGLLNQGWPEEDVRATYKNLSIAAFNEFGVLQGGRFGSSTTLFRDEWVDHFGTFLTQQVDFGEDLTFTIGLGGIYQFQKPEKVSPTWGGTQYKNFFVGPAVAELVFSKPVGGGTATFRGGMFPFKYNPEASNLGEYLFRSGPYPSFIWTGGYAFVNDNRAYLQGLQTGYRYGNFSADLLLTTETAMPPLYDLSLAGIAKYSVGNGLLDLMAGVNFKRLVPIRPSKTTSEHHWNSYFEKDGRNYTGKVSYYDEKADFYDRMLKESMTAQDSAKNQLLLEAASRDADSVRAWVAPTSAFRPDYEYYTHTGTILMAGFVLDAKRVLPAGLFGPHDLKLFAEAALLGVKNYPVFYEDRMRRIPVMAGFNFPTFKLLDILSLQVEYFNSPWINSYEESAARNHATPLTPRGSDRLYSEQEYNDVADKDNFSWSILARKEMVKGLSVSAQFARDHIRSVSEASWAGPGTDPNQLLRTSKDWYWMLQFGFGI